ncbi:MAG: helix-turn-helix domain-containing protein [Solirubrobacterales bacterium]
MSEPWLTKAEVARKLRVSTRTIERLRLPCIRVGGQNRYVMSQVEATLAGDDELPDNVIPLRPGRGRVVA